MLSVELYLLIFAMFVFSSLLLLIIFLTGIKYFFEPNIGSCKCTTKLHGKVVLITGGNSGIGLETAKDLAKRGARIVIASRNEKKSEEAVAQIKQITGNHNVECRQLNLANKTNILQFAKKFNEEFDRLDILVNNAGIGAIKQGNTEDGVDLMMQINHVGPFMLTNLLMDKITASKPSRIVNVTSVAHIFVNLNIEDITDCYKYPQAIRYSKTKLCNILWTRQFAKRLPKGVTANSLHPGIVNTDIFNKSHIKSVLRFLVDMYFRTPLEGAQTIIHMCVSEDLKNSTGCYYKDLKETAPSKVALNSELAEKIWNKTVELIHQ